MSTSSNQSLQLQPIAFSQLYNWSNDDHLSAFLCFQQSAKRITEEPYSTKKIGVNANAFISIAVAALSQSLQNNGDAKTFFETNFIPHKFTAPQGNNLLTGYFEPQIEASTIQTEEFCYPLYRRPCDLVDLNNHNRPSHIDPSFMFGRKNDHHISEYFDRLQIQNGALENQSLELAWLRDPADVFFIHIQGSARLELENGKLMRVSYAAKSGHPYTPIGKILIERGELCLSEVTMQTIRSWMSNNREQQMDLMAENRSYIFFQEIEHPDPNLGPIAAAGVPLTAGRSLAVDHKLHTFGTPIWVQNEDIVSENSRLSSRLLIAQDTGSAIVGEQRGDLYLGSGAIAGESAGGLKAPISMFPFIPKCVVQPS